MESSSRVVPIAFRKAVRGEIAADLAHLVAEHRIVFDPMAVAIDDRMVDFRPNLFRGYVRTHGLLRKVAGWTADNPEPAAGERQPTN
jgi:hypothetical protein